jgi:hypothetical protein
MHMFVTGDRGKNRSLHVVRTVGWLGSMPDLCAPDASGLLAQPA